MKIIERSTFLKNIGLTIMVARRSQGLTVAQLAEKADISTTQIWKIETGQADMKLSTFKKIIDTLGLSEQTLLGAFQLPSI